MNSFVLVVLSCLSTGGDCYPYPIAQDLREMECRNSSQAIIAKWWNEHPNRKVKKYVCVPAQRVESYIGREA